MSLLNFLVENTGYKVYGDNHAEISGISYDSRKVSAGDMFFCLPGHRTDGKKYINEAVSRGARAVVCGENACDETKIPQGTALIVVPDVSRALAAISSKFYGHPSSKLKIIGVTGTNGKTTITYLLESILSEGGIKTSVIGTVNYRLGNEIINAPNTTPQSADIQRLLKMAVDRGFGASVIEASSHGLELGKTEYTEFDAAIFTNLTRDHMDFHKTYNHYFSAKEKLFESLLKPAEKPGKKFAIINADDHWGKKLIGKYSKNAHSSPDSGSAAALEVVTYSIAGGADLNAKDIAVTSEGITFNADGLSIRTPLLGKHNVYNILAAAAAARCFGVSAAAIEKGIAALKRVPGRFESVDCGQDFLVIVDYAHTDDALKNTIGTLKGLKPRRIITVFGCGGDRDRSKRPLMGTVAGEMSDYVIITNDNPRSEDPGKIALDIEVGLRRLNLANYEIILDRAEAIKKALGMASAGDAVLLAGKGHEEYQILGGEQIHFSDVETAGEMLNCRRGVK